MSFAIVAVGLGVAEAVNGIDQANQIRQQGELTNSLQQINAKYADLDAYNEIRFGEASAARYQVEVNQAVSGQKEDDAAKGVDASYGTAKEAIAETKVTGLLNTLDIQNQARMKALGFTQQANNIRYNASVGLNQANSSANAAETSGALRGLQTGISGYQGANKINQTEGFKVG